MPDKKATGDGIPVILDAIGIAATSRTGERGKPIESFVELTRGLPLHGQIYEVVRDWVVTMTLKPGQALSEKDLAARLSVSRTPVREAMIRLSDEGFIDVLPQHGTFVSFIDVDKLDEAGFIRKAVEGAVVVELTKSLNEESVATLNSIMDEQRRAAKSNDYEALETADRRLHSTMPALVGKPNVWWVIKRAMYHLERALRLRKREASNWSETIREHEALVYAIIGRDAEEATSVIRRHIDRNLGEVRIVCDAHPQYFCPNRHRGRPKPELG
jgi:GntR family transcriptional regulator, rspAB operon transcriptional repressor